MVMAIKIPQNEEIYGGGKNGGSKGVVSVIRRKRANGGSVNIRKESKEELFSDMLTLHNQSRGQAKWERR